jgi:molybdopterin/thiamine biosynthesis adenylyltransferase/rhodanese-related sulfurtransferase
MPSPSRSNPRHVDAADPIGQTLSEDELARYARQIRLPDLGVDGQEALKRSAVLIVGAGGLGSPAALYLAAAGVGRIGIADADRVDVSNLHRQILHRSVDVGRRKPDSARAAIESVNPFVQVDAIDERVTSANALSLIARYDVVIDGSDNFPTRYLLSDACVLAGRPLVYGSVDRFEGQVSLFATAEGPCYRCLFPTPPDPGTVQNCADAGVLGVLPGLVGLLQATEALKWIVELGDSLAGRLLLVDALRMRFRTVTIDRDPSCPACGTHEIDSLIDYEQFCEPRAQASLEVDTILPNALSSLLNAGESVVVIDVREPWEWAIGRIPSARLMPLGTLPGAADALERDADIIVYCHHGARSEAAAYQLLDAGFRRVRNLTGGIDRWSRDVDPRVRRY